MNQKVFFLVTLCVIVGLGYFSSLDREIASTKLHGEQFYYSKSIETPTKSSKTEGLVNHEGVAFRFEDYRGKWVLLFFGYFHRSLL